MNKTQEHDQTYYSNDDQHGSSSENINLGGNNVGASMRVYQESFKLGEKSNDCCCINIYINSNVQGVSNSVLYDSQVKMIEPGIRLYFEDLKINRSSTATKMSRHVFWLCLLLLLAFLVFLFHLLSSTRIFIIVV